MSIEEKPFLQIKIDDRIIENHVKDQIQKKLEAIGTEKVFYTFNDLQQITGMSKGFIDKTFFHDSRFEKIRRKIGRKWLFPVKETQSFLLEWIKEQPHH
ncbi:hypothetical protein [Marinilactibacillus sp. Marseille-P9653]|uniref:hypothetical protein n=1 Tax=Marinilactibacillus sp. Marseille-P9653 TaxID=2866583 RepID=UPI001CE474C5|nr:hypothetical protein [Marinilactibacillus sp. Marseille-P9653]